MTCEERLEAYLATVPDPFDTPAPELGLNMYGANPGAAEAVRRMELDESTAWVTGWRW